MRMRDFRVNWNPWLSVPVKTTRSLDSLLLWSLTGLKNKILISARYWHDVTGPLGIEKWSLDISAAVTDFVGSVGANAIRNGHVLWRSITINKLEIDSSYLKRYARWKSSRFLIDFKWPLHQRDAELCSYQEIARLLFFDSRKTVPRALAQSQRNGFVELDFFLTWEQPDFFTCREHCHSLQAVL